MQRAGMYRIAVGLICVVAALLLLLSVASYNRYDPPLPDYPPTPQIKNLCGAVGAYGGWTFRLMFGTGSYLIVIAIGAVGAILLIGRPIEDPVVRTIGVALFVVSWCVGADLTFPSGGMPGGPGGFVGYLLHGHALAALGKVGAYVIVFLGLTVGALFAADAWVLWLGRKSVELLTVQQEPVQSQSTDLEAEAARSRLTPEDRLAEQKEMLRKRIEEQKKSSPGREEEGKAELLAPLPQKPIEEIAEAPTLIIKERRKPPAKVKKAKELPEGEYQIPGFGLLDPVPPPDPQTCAEQVDQKSQILERTLEEFGIAAQVVEIDRGPVITQFELELAPGVKIGKIIGLSDDIARALKAPSVRVVAPIPGKSTVGVEVPNAHREVVRLRELVESGVLDRKRMTLPLLLGKDASGEPLIADLAQMPHLLIAGATGSGKSVAMNSIIMTFLLTQHPDDMKLLLIDPKMVELSAFSDIPLLMAPVLTDMKKAAAVLEWATRKMDERYSLLANVGARNIAAYNALGEGGIRKRLDVGLDDDLEGLPFHLPYIVIIIDELADLMMVSAREVENTITRLAQKSRAVGIHLIVATQRPSVDVVTGLIKANLPSRLAFQTASKVDSRTILDRNGAEKLLGRGDMLFLPPGSSMLIRAQGSFTSDEEIRRVTAFLRERAKPRFDSELVNPKGFNADAASEQDDLFDDAVRIILESQRGSVSLLQRKLGIGYSRAARLVDLMAEAGIVGEYKGSQAREVLYTLDEWESQRGNGSEGE